MLDNITRHSSRVGYTNIDKQEAGPLKGFKFESRPRATEDKTKVWGQ